MKQQSLAANAYAASNGDELPNAPRWASSTGTFAGAIEFRRGRTQPAMAFDDAGGSSGEYNGFAWGTQGVKTLENPFGTAALNMYQTGIDTGASIYNMYWMTLAPFVDGGVRGALAMNDMYVSPSDDNTRRDWQDLRDNLREESGVFPSVDAADGVAGDGEMGAGSYMYVPAATTSVDMYKYNEQGRPIPGTLTASWNGRFNQTITSAQEFYDISARNKMSDIDYSSMKILFFLSKPVHNPDLEAWFQDGADIPVSFSDGSARNTNPQADQAAFNPTENAGSPFSAVWADVAGVPDSDVVFRAPYFLTAGGVKGRDVGAQ